MSAIVTTAVATATAADVLIKAVAKLYKGKETITNVIEQGKQAKKLIEDVKDASTVSLTSYAKQAKLSSRVYIDAGIALDPVVTDVLKTVHTQYAAFILAALQMNQFVTKGSTVQDMLRVVATEAKQIHEGVLEAFVGPSESGANYKKRMEDEAKGQDQKDRVAREERGLDQKDKDLALKTQDLQLKKKFGLTSEIVSYAGDNHIPAGKVIEVTLTNPENPAATVTVQLLVMLAPYIVPAQIAVQFIVRDVIPSLHQRYLQWRTGEISFWKDLIFQSDIVHNRAALLKLDPTGVMADAMAKQQKSQVKLAANVATDKALRARNIANSVLVFSNETLLRAKAETGIDLTDYASRQRYFDMSFAMIIVVVDAIYNQVTFYYNGLEDTGTFSFDQMRVSSKGNNGLDLVSVMNALNQGKSPRF